ncbi:MAG: Fur family transcriptional regulator [Anaerolineae bacterium]
MSDFSPAAARRGPLASALQQAGYRLTNPRLAVLAVLESGACHASPNEVFDLGRAIYPELGLSTVYRTLDILTALGLVRPTYLGDAAQRFTLHHDRQHHHLVCEGCGDITDVEEDNLSDLTARIAGRLGFQAHGHYLEIYGICRRCQGQN